MTKQFLSADVHQAWSRMRYKRECPSIARLRLGGCAVMKHIENCERCSIRYRDMLDSLDYSDVLPKVKACSATIPEIGQIRKIREGAGQYSLANWDEKLLSPPFVIIIKNPNSLIGVVRVAQIHDEPALAAPGDIPIEMPGGTKFAESWNTYPLLPEYLGPILFRTPQEIVSQILAEMENPLPEVPEDSPIEAFRELEIEVGHHYNQLSIAKSLEKLECNNAEKSSQSLISNVNWLFTDTLSYPVEDKEQQDSSRISHVTRFNDRVKYVEKRQSSNIFTMGSWKPLAVAACILLMVGGVFLNQFIPSREDYMSKTEMGTQSSPFLSLMPALQLYLASGGEVTRSEKISHAFGWERKGSVEDIPPKWQAFAAGQWSARANLGQSEPPFPEKWIPAGKNITYWHDNPYFNLGLTAYVADLACQSRLTPADSLADALSNAGFELRKILPGDEPDEITKFIKSLTQKPMSCASIQEKLDDLDSISHLY